MDELFKARTELYVIRAQRGDMEAINLLMALWSSRLRPLVSQWVPPCLIDEVVQQVWLDVFGNIASLTEPAHFQAWMRRIAFRCSATLLRQRRSHAQLDPDSSFCELVPSWLPILVSLLGPTHRKVFAMHYLDGYSVDEISKCLELPVGTIKSRLHASRFFLRLRLGDLMENQKSLNSMTP